MLEHEIKLDLIPPDQKLLVGYIDRIVFNDEKVMILDYKTTKAGFYQKDNNTIKQDLQLRTYAYYVCKEFKLQPDKVFLLLVLSGKQKISLY